MYRSRSFGRKAMCKAYIVKKRRLCRNYQKYGKFCAWHKGLSIKNEKNLYVKKEKNIYIKKEKFSYGRKKKSNSKRNKRRSRKKSFFDDLNLW